MGKDSVGKRIEVVMGPAAIAGMLGPTLTGWICDIFGSDQPIYYVFAGLSGLAVGLILRMIPVNSMNRGQTGKCKVDGVIELGRPGRGNSLVLGQAVLIHVKDELLKDDVVRPEDLKPPGRLGGNLYCQINYISVWRRRSPLIEKFHN